MTDPNDPARPTADSQREGLTIREHFAGQIMAGLALDQRSTELSTDDLATTAVLWADALIVALNRRPVKS